MIRIKLESDQNEKHKEHSWDPNQEKMSSLGLMSKKIT